MQSCNAIYSKTKNSDTKETIKITPVFVQTCYIATMLIQQQDYKGEDATTFVSNPSSVGN